MLLICWNMPEFLLASPPCAKRRQLEMEPKKGTFLQAQQLQGLFLSQPPYLPMQSAQICSDPIFIFQQILIIAAQTQQQFCSKAIRMRKTRTQEDVWSDFRSTVRSNNVFFFVDSSDLYNLINRMSRVELGTSMEEADLEQSVVNEHINSNNTDGLKKMIYKYQSKIKELLKTISKQKKANDQLRQELKQLNETLNQLINKVTIKAKQQKDDPIKEEIVKKELENQMKKTHALKKQVETLKVKLKVYESQKVGDLYNQIREKDRVIEDLHQSLKLHERFEKKEMTLDIYKREQEAQKKIKMMTEQIGHLKKKMQDQKKMHDIQERSILFQQKKMNQLQIKQKSLPKVNQNESQGPKETYELLQKENKSLKEQLDNEEKGKKIAEKMYRGEIQSVKAKLRSSEKAIVELKEQLAKKDKQINSLWQRTKYLEKNSSTQKQLPSEEVAPSWIQMLNCRRQLKGASNIRPGAKRFDDCQKLPQDKQYKIRGLLFRYFQEHIIQLRITYDILGEAKTDRQQETVTTFSIEAPYQSTKEASIQLGEYEYVTEWQIFLGKGIEYMRIRTSKEQLLEVGNERNSLKCKRLPFQIKTFEKPIACFGIVDTRSVGERQRQVLVGLGLVLKRKNIFGGRAQSLARLQKASLSLASKYNDKNIV